jgi:hypothetical protein
MSVHWVASMATVMVGVAFALRVSVHTTNQAPRVATHRATPWTAPRTPWGEPDLQGIWTGSEMVGVPFERPKEFGERAYLSDEEFAAAKTRMAKQAAADREQAPSERSLNAIGEGTDPPYHWGERGKPQRQASLIVDPPDGRMPPMTPEGQTRTAAIRNSARDGQLFLGPQDFGLYERCITRGVLGAMPPTQSPGNEIIQAPGVVVFRHELMHELRIIPVDGRSHLSPVIRQYMGDSRGHWEGDTLVVETTNFTDGTGISGNGRDNPFSSAMRLVERFRRLDATTLQHEATLSDPKTWTKPWTISVPLKRDAAYQIFEYACHEGNRPLAHMLSGSRAIERKAGER